MKFKLTVCALLYALMMLQTASADDLTELKAQLKAMQQYMQVMQAKLDTQETVLKKLQAAQAITHQQAERVKDKELSDAAHTVAKSISISGVVDVIANNTTSDGWSGETAGDLVLDTLELAIDASAGDWTSAHILLLYEDGDDDNLNIDEAFISFANAGVSPFYAAVGRMYVPFGNFSSNMNSDPVTLTLGETREDALQLGIAADNGFYGAAYIFTGDTEKAKSDYNAAHNNTIDNYGLNLGYMMENNDLALDIGVAYVNNIAASDTLQDIVADNGLCAGDGCIKDYVGGLSVYAIASYSQFSLIGEYVTALDDFKMAELTTINDKKLKPGAWNIEGAYNFQLLEKDTTIALGYQQSKDMYFDTATTDFFEKAWLASISVGITDNTSLSAELKHSDGYSEVADQRKADGDKYSDEDMMQIKLSYVF
ncbi:MAG: LbtU family siderophore porin [gamma proteobacterium symbiont of Lucinoma myriamae]|nr:LbtU family siderophore porin [gamma proteobacterium symbiont of Lucinoma myriamae]MCU7817552.1 LbtU family siderophore porin [gamma proteobacterium symbiont of Lucinoma myriamae]MCU7831626.1 LbtU family siderophore porin [gamma proteobacterium symbiont of Lucinoma myriamae]